MKIGLGLICQILAFGSCQVLAETGPVSLRLIPRSEISDPNGLTFFLAVPSGERAANLGQKFIHATWNGPDDSPGKSIPARHFLLPAAGGYFLHVRRILLPHAPPHPVLKIRVTLPDGKSLLMTPALPPGFQQNQVDVMLLIDESLSMKRNDRQRLRVAAARAFINLAASGGRIGRIGIVAFNHQSRLLFPLTRLSHRQALIEAADGIGNTGETDMDAALELAFHSFETGTGTRKVAILLTDGKDQPGRYEGAHHLFAEKHWPIHSIGLSAKADHGTLKKIARETGGQYHAAPSSAELQRIFGAICFSLQNRTLITRRNWTPGRPGAAQPLAVDRSIRNLTLTCESDQSLEYRLSPPPGAGTARITRGGEAGYRYFDLWTPPAGSWTLTCPVKSGQALASVKLEATAISSLNLWHFPLQDRYEWGEPVDLAAGLAEDNNFLAGAKISALITSPDGKTSHLKYRADGELYRSVFFKARSLGRYSLSVRATGLTSDGDPFERQVFAHFVVKETRSPRLWISSRALDFGQLYPGEMSTPSLTAKIITARKLLQHPVQVVFSEFRGPHGETLPERVLKLRSAPLHLSSEAAREVKVELTVPLDARPGPYHGKMLLQADFGPEQGYTETSVVRTEIPVLVNVAAPQIAIEPGTIDLATMQPGESSTLNLSMRTVPRGRLLASIQFLPMTKDMPMRTVAPSGRNDPVPANKPELQFPPRIEISSQPISLPITFRAGRSLPSGILKGTFHIQAGIRSRDMPFQVALQRPALSFSPGILDFGQVFVGQTTEQTLTVAHTCRTVPGQLHIQLPQPTAASAPALHFQGQVDLPNITSANTRATLQTAIQLGAGKGTRPGPISGKLYLRTWFQTLEVPWKARVAVASGFYLSQKVVRVPAIRPGTTHSVSIDVVSTIQARQGVRCRASRQGAGGVEPVIRPSEFVLPEKGHQKITIQLKSSKEAEPGPLEMEVLFHGPHNRAVLQVRSLVLPKQVPVPPPVKLLPPPSPSPPEPVFSVHPATIDFGARFPGQMAEAQLLIETNVNQQVRVAFVGGLPASLCLELDPPVLPVGTTHSQTVALRCYISPEATPGTFEPRLELTNGKLAATVLCKVVIQQSRAPVVSPPPPAPFAVNSAPPATANSKWKVSPLLYYLFWALLILLALLALLYALRWIFSFDVPEMTKFYLASGIFHVLAALLAAVYYIQPKIVEIDDAQKIRVHLVRQTSKKKSEAVAQKDAQTARIARSSIQTKSDAKEVRQQYKAASKGEQVKKAAKAKEYTRQPDTAQLQKETEQARQKLASTNRNPEKSSQRPRSQPATRPSLQVRMKEISKEQEDRVQPTQPEKPDRETDRAKQRTASTTKKVQPEKVRPEAASPERVRLKSPDRKQAKPSKLKVPRALASKPSRAQPVTEPVQAQELPGAKTAAETHPAPSRLAKTIAKFAASNQASSAEVELSQPQTGQPSLEAVPRTRVSAPRGPKSFEAPLALTQPRQTSQRPPGKREDGPRNSSASTAAASTSRARSIFLPGEKLLLAAVTPPQNTSGADGAAGPIAPRLAQQSSVMPGKPGGLAKSLSKLMTGHGSGDHSLLPLYEAASRGGSNTVERPSPSARMPSHQRLTSGTIHPAKKLAGRGQQMPSSVLGPTVEAISLVPLPVSISSGSLASLGKGSVGPKKSAAPHSEPGARISVPAPIAEESAASPGNQAVAVPGPAHERSGPASFSSGTGRKRLARTTVTGTGRPSNTLPSDQWRNGGDGIAALFASSSVPATGKARTAPLGHIETGQAPAPVGGGQASEAAPPYGLSQGLLRRPSRGQGGSLSSRKRIVIGSALPSPFPGESVSSAVAVETVLPQHLLSPGQPGGHDATTLLQEGSTQFTAYVALFRGSNPAFDRRLKRAFEFLKDEVTTRLDFVLSSQLKIFQLSDRKQVMAAPWIFISGEFPFQFTQQEADNLREYIEEGGWVWVDDCTDQADTRFDSSFRSQMQVILPDAEIRPLPMTHPIFSICYDLSRGYLGYEIPPGDKYRENRLHAYYFRDRPVVVYSRNDYHCGLDLDLKTFNPVQRSLTDLTPKEMINGSVMMSMNLIFYFLGEDRLRGITSRFAKAAARDSEQKFAQQQKRLQLYLRGVQYPPLEDFEGGKASLWTAIGRDQMDDANWNDVDPSRGTLVGPKGQRMLQVSFPMKKGKAVVEKEFPDPVNLKSVQGLLVDIENRSPALVRVALGLSTLPDWEYFESPPLYIRPGLNPNVVFEITGQDFKAATSDWEYRAALSNSSEVKKIFFLIYAVRPGSLRFDNIRLSKFPLQDQ